MGRALGAPAGAGDGRSWLLIKHNDAWSGDLDIAEFAPRSVKSDGDFEDILAVCVQHEMDHLEGRLFVDYLSDLKRERIRKKLDKDRKERASQPATATVGARRAY